MPTFPRSPSETAGGMRYFPRMLDKIRLHARDELPLEYHANMGKPVSADGTCINFLRINYNELCERVKQGGTDEEILEWCYQNGRRLNEGDLIVWNNFMAKFGWNDFATSTLDRLKRESGVSNRDDLRTIGDFIDFDEKRKS